MTGTTRACLTCATPITVTTRNPNRRFCTPRCRAEDWRRRHTPAPASSPPNAANAVNSVPRADNVTNGANPVRRQNEVANDDRRATLARCPHCQTPLTVLTWLLPPAAAHVAIPPAPRHG